MANLNRVLLLGRLTRDPESRTTSGGTSVVAFGLAINRSYSRKDSGERVEETCFVDVEAWGRTGETISRYMKKGRQIFIEGRLRLDTWEKEGQRRSKLLVVAETFQFVDSQQGGGGDGGGGGAGGGSYERAPARVGSHGGGAGSPGAAGPGGGGTPQDDYEDDIPF